MRRIVAALLLAFALLEASLASAGPDLSSCGAKDLARYIGAPVDALKRVRQDEVALRLRGLRDDHGLSRGPVDG